MNSRERVYKALEHEEVDIIPYVDFFGSGAAYYFLGKKYLEADDLSKTIFAAKLFNLDVVNIPVFAGPWDVGIFGEVLYGGEDHVVIESPFGGLFYYRKRPYFVKILSPPIRCKEDLNRIGEINSENYKSKIKYLAEKAEKLHDLDYFVISEIKDPFASTWMLLRDLTTFLLDIIREPEFARRLIELAFPPFIELSEMVVEETSVDAIYVTGDLAGEKLFFSPTKYREIFQPWDREVVRRIHAKGAKVLRHSHGDITLLLHDIVEAGYDWIDPLDPSENITHKDVKEKYGDKITLVGGISKNIGIMSRGALRRHINDVVKTLGPRGFILGSAGGVPPGMSLENFNYYRYVVEKARRFRL